MRIERIACLTAAAIIVLAGCAQSRWVKDGTAESIAQHDASQCDFEARARASRVETASVNRNADDPFNTSGHRDIGHAVTEMNLAAQCMRAKGYTLVPTR